jgi:hypothetical protein
VAGIDDDLAREKWNYRSDKAQATRTMDVKNIEALETARYPHIALNSHGTCRTNLQGNISRFDHSGEKVLHRPKGQYLGIQPLLPLNMSQLDSYALSTSQLKAGQNV